MPAQFRFKDGGDDENRVFNKFHSALSARIAAGVETLWSRRTHARMRATLAQFSPAVAHFHNTFPRMSPGVYYACREAGVPVVQTLHNDTDPGLGTARGEFALFVGRLSPEKGVHTLVEAWQYLPGVPLRHARCCAPALYRSLRAGAECSSARGHLL